MATVDEVVRYSISHYPMLNDNRTTVLHNVLCVIGTGYDWDENGEIAIPVFYDDDAAWTPENERAARAKMLSSYPAELLSYLDGVEERERFEKRIQQLAEVVANLDERIHQRVEHEIKPDAPSSSDINIYPQSEYAPLVNVPANVTADWREAVEEMREYASKRGWKF